jgi:hypothetical protein
VRTLLVLATLALAIRASALAVYAAQPLAHASERLVQSLTKEQSQ